MHDRNHTLRLQDVHKQYGQGEKKQLVLNGISAQFNQRNTYAITGVSGSGKSTLLHLLGGLDIPTSGVVLFDDKNIARMRKYHKNQFLNQCVGFVFQFHYLIKELCVLENIMLTGLIKGERRFDCQERAMLLLDMVGLADKAQSYPSQLSGGEQQRVSLARSLLNKPAFLLADEPTGNLDANNAQRVIDILMQARQAWGMGMVICSHDPSVYARMETVYKLHQGVLE